MLQPIHTPHPGQDRIAGLLIHLESHIAPSLTLTPLAIRRESGMVEARVIVRTADNVREHLTPEEARTMAMCLVYDPHISDAAHRHIFKLRAAADAAEQAATAIVVGQDSSHLVGMGERS